MYKAHYWRYQVQDFAEFDTLDEAIAFQMNGVENLTHAPDRIEDADGNVVRTRNELSDIWMGW